MSQLQKTPQSPAAKRVAAYRKRMRAAGLVPKTIWVPNTKDPAFLAEYDRECRTIAASEDSRKAQEFMDGLYAENDLGPIPAYRLPGSK
jgi:hypothetical protein